MSVAILKEIKAVEEQAEQIEATAVQKAREAVAAAKREAAELKLKSAEQAESEAGRIVGAFEEKARQDISGISVQIQAQCDEIRSNSNSRIKEAEDFIIGRIVKP